MIIAEPEKKPEGVVSVTQVMPRALEGVLRPSLRPIPSKALDLM